MDAELQRATAAFPEPLPEGIQWPRRGMDFADPALNPEQKGRVVPHPGIHDEFVAGYWLCSWMDVYLRSLDDDNSPQRKEAVSNLGKYTSLPIVKQNLFNPDDFEAGIVIPAQRGEPAAVGEYFKAGCDPYRDNQPGPPAG
jgi:hypothetical protein